MQENFLQARQGASKLQQMAKLQKMPSDLGRNQDHLTISEMSGSSVFVHAAT
jgi:hypothetical protein